MIPFRDLDTKILMVHLMEYHKDGTAHEKLVGLLDRMSLVQEDGTVLGYSVIV